MSATVVYGDTNLVLELALQQEDNSAANDIFAMAHAGDIQLLLPAFTLSEQRQTLQAKWSTRTALSIEVVKALGDVSRSDGWEDANNWASHFSAMLARKTQEEEDRYPEVIGRVLAVATIIPLSERILLQSRELTSTTKSIKVPDSLVIASVLDHLRSHQNRPCYFISRDGELIRDVRDMLLAEGCRSFKHFSKAVEAIKRT